MSPLRGHATIAPIIGDGWVHGPADEGAHIIGGKGTTTPPRACILGLDLAGSPRRPTGFCVLRNRRVQMGHVFGDEDILGMVVSASPQLVAIDAPLALPAGRCCLRNTCVCAGTTHFRVSDLELRRLGIRFFPMTLGPMRQLTMRGMHLKAVLEARGLTVIETYPGGAQDLWGIPRQRDVVGLKRGLARFRLRGLGRTAGSPHMLDAVTCALVGQLYLDGQAWSLGSAEEAFMILPRPAACTKLPLRHPRPTT